MRPGLAPACAALHLGAVLLDAGQRLNLAHLGVEFDTRPDEARFRVQGSAAGRQASGAGAGHCAHGRLAVAVLLFGGGQLLVVRGGGLQLARLPVQRLRRVVDLLAQVAFVAREVRCGKARARQVVPQALKLHGLLAVSLFQLLGRTHRLVEFPRHGTGGIGDLHLLGHARCAVASSARVVCSPRVSSRNCPTSRCAAVSCLSFPRRSATPWADAPAVLLILRSGPDSLSCRAAMTQL